MSNYTQITNFTAKDSLLSGDPLKKIKGAQIDAELAAISTAIATKYDSTTIGSSPVLFADGAAATPSVAFASATGTGIYKAAANSLGFAANGASAGSIAANGAWTIPGTNAANSYALTINNAGPASQSLGLLIQAGTNSSDAALAALNKGGTITFFEVYGDGEVVINDTSGTAKNGASGGTGTLWQAGYLDTPQHGITTSTTLALTDRGKHIFINGSTAGQTLTIPANASVAFPIGTTITIVNFSSQSWNIAITTDTLYWTPSGSQGTRVIAGSASLVSCATIMKIGATQWIITGNGLT